MEWNVGSRGAVALLCSIACAPKEVLPEAESSSTDAMSVDASTSSSDSTTGAGLEGCHALPEAEVAQWIEGPASRSTAESSAERIAAAGASSWDIALDMLRLVGGEHSFASSPTSMQLSLGLAYRRWQHSGTPCAPSIHDLMHFPETDDALHETFGAMARALESRSLPGDADSDPVTVSLQQSMWEIVSGDPGGIELDGDSDYGATRNAVSRADPDALAAIHDVINCVIEEQSAGLLVDFLPPQVPDAYSTSFDIDVAFLQSPWSTALEAGLAVQFTADDASTSTLPAVGGIEIEASFHEDDDAIVLELPLRSPALAVAFVMPKRAAHPTLAAFVAATTAADLRGAVAGATNVSADVTIPTVQIPSETIDYFSLFGFACDPDTELRRVMHGATIEIDEKGIKAAAATVSEGGADSSGGTASDVVVVLDHPFLFFVHDRITGNVLYSGRYAGG